MLLKTFFLFSARELCVLVKRIIFVIYRQDVWFNRFSMSFSSHFSMFYINFNCTVFNPLSLFDSTAVAVWWNNNNMHPSRCIAKSAHRLMLMASDSFVFLAFIPLHYWHTSFSAAAREKKKHKYYFCISQVSILLHRLDWLAAHMKLF